MSEETGDVDVDVAISSLTAADVTAVSVTITGPGMAPMQATLTKVGAVYRGTIGAIPAGSARVFTGEARNGTGTVLYRGQSAPVVIAPGPAALVALRLQQVMAPDPFHNGTPHIDALFVSAQAVAPGEIINLSATATDADGDPLTFMWTGGGTFTTPSVATTSWVAPTGDGSYVLTIGVVDPKQARNAISVTINVSTSNAKGSAKVTADVNTFPQVVGLTLVNSRLVPGQSALATTTSFEADGDAITYVWSSTCGGVWTGTGATSAVQIPATIATTCRVRVDVADGRGGSSFGELDVAVGPGPVGDFAPVIDQTFQSLDIADNGENVVLRISAHDPEGAPLVFSWSTTQGTSNGVVAGGELEVTWTAPACFTGSATIVLSVRDQGGPVVTNQTSRAFVVNAVRTSCVPSGLLSWWRADGTTSDSIGGRDGIASPSDVAYGPGIHGQAFVFDGAHSFHAPSTGFPSGSASRTIELWARVDGATQQPLFGGYGAPGSVTQAYLLGTLDTGLVFCSTWGPALFGGAITVASGWHHVAATNIAGDFVLYVDGVSVGTAALGVSTMTGPGYDFILGYADSSRRLIGAIDEVRVYDRALSAAEVAQIAAGNGGY